MSIPASTPVAPALAQPNPTESSDSPYAALLTQIMAEPMAAANRRGLQLLSREENPRLFFSGLLHWAQRQENAGNVSLALFGYAAIRHSTEAPLALQRESIERIATLNGEGALGDHLELTFRNLSRELLRPSNIFPIVLTGLTFRVARIGAGALLRDLGWVGPSLRMGANLLAFNAEAMAYPIYQRSIRMALGEAVDTGPNAFAQELASSYLFLGSFRLFGLGGRYAFEQFHGVASTAALSPGLAFSRSVFQTGAQFFGIFSALGLENYFSAHPVSRDAVLARSLAGLIHLKATELVVPHLMGPRLRALEATLDTLGNQTERPTILTSLASSLGPWGPRIFMTQSQRAEDFHLPPSAPPPDIHPATGSNGRPHRISDIRELLPPPPNESSPPPRPAALSDETTLAALLRHRGSLREAAASLEIQPDVFSQFLREADIYSELNIFPSANGGRMLFYTPALQRARAHWGDRLDRPESLAELELSVAASAYLSRMGATSLRDVLLLTRFDFHQARQAEESVPQIDGIILEVSNQFNHRLGVGTGVVRDHHPIPEGHTKRLLLEIHGEEPLSALALPRGIPRLLKRQGFSTLGDLLRRPIPQWVSTAQLPPTGPLARRGEVDDAIIRSLFGFSVHGVRNRQAEAPPALLSSEIGVLSSALVANHGLFRPAAESLGLTTEALHARIEALPYHSELAVYQRQNTMLFYTPALRTARSRFGDSINRPESLAALGLSRETQGVLQDLGVESLRDALMLTRFDFHYMGETRSEEARFANAADELVRQINTRLNHDAPLREHHPLPDGTLRAALLHHHANRPIESLGLPTPLSQDLQGRGLSTMGDLMETPLPLWFPRTQRRTDLEDAVIRSIYRMARQGN